MLLFGNKTKKFYTEKQKIHQLQGSSKLRYIWDYYKIPLIVLYIILNIIGYSLYGHYTHKALVLSVAFVNVAPNDTLSAQLSTDFLNWQNLDSKANELRLSSNLYLTDDKMDPNHEYTYASRMKILGSIDNEELDIVFMNKEAFDAFAQSGYLCNIDDLLSTSNETLSQQLVPFLQTNTVILEDNSMELYFDDSISYSAKTETYPMAIDVSQSPVIQKANMNGPIYMGVIANSLHRDAAVNFISYLWS